MGILGHEREQGKYLSACEEGQRGAAELLNMGPLNAYPLWDQKASSEKVIGPIVRILTLLLYLVAEFMRAVGLCVTVNEMVAC